MQKIEKVLQLIKGTDCTACGAPDCRTFAEDVVRGEAKLNDCVNIVDK
jgi:Na+-translocating ferredoxin:NAD+ oxidoreductase RNF subunit RnfB